MVIIEGLFEFVGNMVGEGQAEVVGVVIGVELYGFFIQFNCFLIVLQLAVHVRQVELDRLQDLVGRAHCQRKRSFKLVLGLGVVFMFIINHARLVVDLRVKRVYVLRLLKG